MCRLVAYLGQSILLENVLVKPINSIVMQSLHARETSWPTNGDGFGLGWYAPEISDTPAIFKSISPAWNDNNLLHLTAKIKSSNFFAHVRAASGGGVTHYNCHPYARGPWMMMHNGEIGNFMDVKRHLRRLLSDDIYNWIQGETDSEHLFALFLELSKGKDLSKISVVADVLQETFEQVLKLIHEFSKFEPCYFNVCLTDGHRLVATRFCNDKKRPPESMHYTMGSHFVEKNGKYHMLAKEGKRGSILIASERLTDFDAEWTDMPPNHLMTVDTDLSIELRPL